MKLMIDIHDDEYKALKTTGSWNSGLIECIKNGIPLDKIADEVNKLKKVGYEGEVYVPINAVFGIIDKYMVESKE